MATETYTVRFAAEDTLSGAIAKIRGGLVDTAAAAKGADGPLGAMKQDAKAVAATCGQLLQALDGIGKTIGPDKVAAAFGRIDQAIAKTRSSLSGLALDLAGLNRTVAGIGGVANAMTSLGRVTGDTTGQVTSLGSEVLRLRELTPGVGAVREAMVTLQRTTYGAKMNAGELNAELSRTPGLSAAIAAAGQQLGAGAAPLGTVRGAAAELNQEIGVVGTQRVASFSSGLLGLAARVAVFQSLKSAITDVGKAMGDARDKMDAMARTNLDLRDKYRELANLEGKPTVDNEVMGGVMRFRMATGESDEEANETMRRFQGGIPVAIDAGNITGSATTGVAGQFLAETARTAGRYGVAGGDAAQLATQLAVQGKIPSADAGANRVGTIFESYKRAIHDVGPMIKAGLARSAGMVGAGLDFGTQEDFTAAHVIADTSGASPAVAATKVSQAANALSHIRGNQGRFVGKGVEGLTPEWAAAMNDKRGDDLQSWVTENYGEEKWTALQNRQLASEKKGVIRENDATSVFLRSEVAKSQSQVQKVPNLGMKPGEFAANVARLAPLLEGKEDLDAELQGAGVKTRAQRQSLIYFYQNRDKLQTETTNVRKGVDVAAIRRGNDAFYRSDAMQAKIGAAENDSSKFTIGAEREKLVAARDSAEARLRLRREIDSPAAAADQAVQDNPVLRLGAGVASLMTGGLSDKAVGPGLNQLPMFMGGKATKDLLIDQEVARGLKREGARVGVNTDAVIRNSVPEGAPPEERTQIVAQRVQDAGGSIRGDNSEVLGGINALVSETKRTNELLQQQIKQQAAPQPLPRPIDPMLGGFGLFPGGGF